MMKFFVGLFVLFVSFTNILSKELIAVLPFQNMDGKIELNVWSYQLQDSLYKALLAQDPNSNHYQLVPIEDIEMQLAQLNLDPTNPQYSSDMWKAVKELNATKVISGNFNLNSGKYLINAYIYDVKMKLANPRHQAKDIFKSEADVLESIEIIVEVLNPLLMK